MSGLLPDCPQCGRTIHRAERIGVSAAVEPCGHFIPADFFKPSHVERGVQQELVADGGRRKTEFWGYEQHHRSVRDVVDEDRWHDEERWAVDEALGYARVISVPSSPLGACHLLQQPFIDHFEAMLDGFLHKPLDICTATKRTQKTEQTTLCDGGVVREDLSTFGGGVDYAPHVSLMDCVAAVRAAGIEEPLLTDPLRSWREFEAECDERVFRTTLYAIRRACPDAPAAPSAEPPETDYAFEVASDDGPEQVALGGLSGGEST